MLVSGRRGFPNIAGLFARHEADSPLNTLIDTDTKITDFEDLSGNENHSTSAGMGFEVTGSSQGLSCIKAINTLLKWAGNPTSSQHSIFWIAQGTTFQVINSDAGAGSNIAITWNIDSNSPLVSSDVPADIVVGSGGTPVSDYSDEVMRAYCWNYNSATGLVDFWVNAVRIATTGDWTIESSGAIEFFQLGRNGGTADNRTAAVLFYDGVNITQRNIQDLYTFYQQQGIVL